MFILCRKQNLMFIFLNKMNRHLNIVQFYDSRKCWGVIKKIKAQPGE